MILLAAVATGLACWVLLGRPAAARLKEDQVRTAAWGDRFRAFAPGGAAAGVVVLGWILGGAPVAAVVLAVDLPLLTAGAVWRKHHRRTAAQKRAKDILAACQLLAGLLRVGHVPAAALQVAAADEPVLAEAAALRRIGAPVGTALRRQGTVPGCAGLTELGIAWEVAERTGASLTATLDALTVRLAARQAVLDVVAAELSAPRATGRLLAVLPVVGVLLGYSFGGDPLTFLTESPVGQISLVVGSGLGCAGVLWTERVADAGGG